MHAWSMNSFTHIGHVWGVSWKSVKVTREKMDIGEVKIKVKHNYTSFIPALINIINEIENRYIVQTVIQMERRWLVERNARIHMKDRFRCPNLCQINN